MQTFVTKVSDRLGHLFKVWCTERETTPYAVLSNYIDVLTRDMHHLDTADQPPPAEPIDLSVLATMVFPNPESAMLALDLSRCQTIDELPVWFTQLVADKALLHHWDSKKLIRKLAANMQLLRQLVIEETEASAREQALKIKEHPIAPQDLDPAQRQAPRITLTDEEANKIFDDLCSMT